MPKHYPKIFILFFIALLQSLDIKAQNEIAQKADSLFSANNYLEASKLYETIKGDKLVNKENLFLKLAFINENQNNFPKAIYYLNNYYNLKPKDEVFEKMNKIALEHKFSGFERSDLNFILMIYQQYYYYILYLFLIIGFFILALMFRKVKANEKLTFRNKIVAGIYIGFLILILNIPNSYKSGIVNQVCYIRNFPSSGAPIIGQISLGNKINVFGQNDIWLKVLYHKSIVYVNKRDIWLLDS